MLQDVQPNVLNELRTNDHVSEEIRMMLFHTEPCVRKTIVCILGRLSKSSRSMFASKLQSLLEDQDDSVRHAVAGVLGTPEMEQAIFDVSENVALDQAAANSAFSPFVRHHAKRTMVRHTVPIALCLKHLLCA